MARRCCDRGSVAGQRTLGVRGGEPGWGAMRRGAGARRRRPPWCAGKARTTMMNIARTEGVRRRLWVWARGPRACALGAAVLGVGLIAQGTRGPSAGFACISKPSDMREIGFPVRGTLFEVNVKPGDVVSVGMALARLDDRVQARTVELAKLSAEDGSQVALAEKSVSFRVDELRAIEDALQQTAGNKAELREARFKRDSAEIELAGARVRQRSDQVTLERERARLEEMSIVSPLAGTVIDVHKRSGETVDQGTTVVTLVSVDPLWIEVNVPTNTAMGIEVGRGAVVDWDDVRGVEAMRGRVIYKSPVANAGARQVQLRVELPNPARIPSGMHGTVRFDEASAGGAGR